MLKLLVTSAFSESYSEKALQQDIASFCYILAELNHIKVILLISVSSLAAGVPVSEMAW